MNCQDAKRLMALHIGQDDADVSDWEQVRRHAVMCIDCRKHYRGLKQSMTVLETADVESTYEVRESLWPEIESRLENGVASNQPNRSKPWAPVISFTVACVLFMMVAAYQPVGPNSGHGEVQHAPKGMGFPLVSPQHRSDEIAREDKKTSSRLDESL